MSDPLSNPRQPVRDAGPSQDVVPAKSQPGLRGAAGKSGGDAKLKQRLQALRTRDSLTGLYNRAHFLRFLQSALRDAPADGLRALLYLRPDGFGAIDARIGPSASDELLAQLAGVCKDVLTERSLLARFGGTVFVAMVQREDPAEFAAIAEQLLGIIAGRIFESGSQSASLTASIGLVILPPTLQSADEAVSLAQSAAALARQEGGNRVQLEQPDEQETQALAASIRRQKRIRAALQNDGFTLAYQPIADLDGSTSFSYDVLLRMQGEGGEEVLPGEFLPVAEAAGLMPQIDRWVIRRAFAVAARRFAGGKKTRVFLRVSEATLADPEFSGWLGLEALAHRLDRESVVLQLPDAIVENRLPLVRELATSCRDLHLQVSLASAGPALRCQRLLDEAAFDFLVLDGRFVKEEDRGALGSLVDKARSRDIQVIATQIESAADLAQLYSLGVDYVSGFHVQAPEEEMVEGVNVSGPDTA